MHSKTFTVADGRRLEIRYTIAETAQGYQRVAGVRVTDLDADEVVQMGEPGYDEVVQGVQSRLNR